MSIRNRFFAIAALLLAATAAYAEGIQGQFQDGINGQFSNGIWTPNKAAPVNPPPPPFFTPVVVVNACSIAVPVTNGSPVALAGGGNCSYTATCGGLACTGGNAISGWAITAQSCASCFAVDGSGDLLGSTNAANVVTFSTYTVTVTATNPTGTSAPVVQTITTPGVRAAPVVAVNNCNINLPVTTGSPVALSGGGNCGYTATCGGVSCTGGDAITAWNIITQSCANCFAINGSGGLLGGSAAGTVLAGNSYTVTVTASNNTGTSPQVVEGITVNTGNCLLAQTGSPILASLGGPCILVQ